MIENVIIIIRQVYKGRGKKESRLRVTGLPKKIVTGALAGQNLITHTHTKAIAIHYNASIHGTSTVH